jgi:predicted nucleic-acid-binding Zn-ribbon protein
MEKQCPKCGSKETVEFTTWEEECDFALFFTGHTCMNCAYNWQTAKIGRIDNE